MPTARWPSPAAGALAPWPCISLPVINECHSNNNKCSLSKAYLTKGAQQLKHNHGQPSASRGWRQRTQANSVSCERSRKSDRGLKFQSMISYVTSHPDYTDPSRVQNRNCKNPSLGNETETSQTPPQGQVAYLTPSSCIEPVKSRHTLCPDCVLSVPLRIGLRASFLPVNLLNLLICPFYR